MGDSRGTCSMYAGLDANECLYVVCSECGSTFYESPFGGKDMSSWSYCPSCGARIAAVDVCQRTHNAMTCDGRDCD